MNNLSDLEDSLSCKAYLPKSKPETARSCSKQRLVSSKLKKRQNFDSKKFNFLESVGSMKRVVFRHSKLVCDVGCSTRENFNSIESLNRNSPVLPARKSKGKVTISFTRLNLPSFENRESFLQRFPFSVRKSQRIVSRSKVKSVLNSRENERESIKKTEIN